MSRSFSIGAEREIVSGLRLAADYVHTLADNLLLTYDVNYPAPVTRVRPNAAFLAISRFQTTGRAWSDALLLRLDRRAGPTFGVSYTLSKAERDTEDFQFIAQDMNNLAAERGPANNDRRHQLVAHVVYRLPLDFQVGGYFSARSGLPFTVTTGRDNNGDTNINDRPDLVNPSGNPLDKSTYDFTFTGHTGNLPRNSARGPAFTQLDVRASKFFRIGSRRVEAFFEAFNITDRVNFATPVGNLASSSFGKPTALGGSPRQGEFGFRCHRHCQRDLKGRSPFRKLCAVGFWKSRSLLSRRAAPSRERPRPIRSGRWILNAATVRRPIATQPLSHDRGDTMARLDAQGKSAFGFWEAKRDRTPATDYVPAAAPIRRAIVGSFGRRADGDGCVPAGQTRRGATATRPSRADE